MTISLYSYEDKLLGTQNLILWTDTIQINLELVLNFAKQ